jgi:hypothetical protein
MFRLFNKIVRKKIVTKRLHCFAKGGEGGVIVLKCRTYKKDRLHEEQISVYLPTYQAFKKFSVSEKES